MHKVRCLLLAILAGGAALAAVPAGVPFTIDVSEAVAGEFPGAPRLQSFSFAQWKGRWVFIGGRVSGYHAVGGGSAEFLRADANREIWVRSEEHTSELQSLAYLVCRLLLEKKKIRVYKYLY